MWKQFLWNFAKPIIEEWLMDRALKLPASVVIQIAKQSNVSEEVVMQVNAYMISEALKALDKFKP